MTDESDFDNSILRVREDRISELLTEIERLQAIAENAEALRRNLEDVSCRQQNEIERLKEEIDTCRELRRYDRIDMTDDDTILILRNQHAIMKALTKLLWEANQAEEDLDLQKDATRSRILWKHEMLK